MELFMKITYGQNPLAIFGKKPSQTFHTVRNTLLVTRSTHRSSHQRCSVRKDILRNFTNVTGKHLCHSFFFRKKLY